MTSRKRLGIIGGLGALGIMACFALFLPAAPADTPPALIAGALSDASPVPAPAAVIAPLEGPWQVAVQPGHWLVDRLPDELARLRGSSGAAYGEVHEVDINIAVARALLLKIDARGWKARLVPATVPPRLRADAFVSIHADYGSPDRRGWKLAPGWRASPASRSLAAALRGVLLTEPGLVEDTGHVTINMRGYFGFNHRRFEHAASPFTPAVLLELGLISNAQDRGLLTSRPDWWADLIVRGLEVWFKDRRRDDISDLRPLELPWLAAGPGGAPVFRSPGSQSPEQAWVLGAGTVVLPVDAAGDWYEVFDRRRWATGWVRASDTVPAGDPRWPLPGEIPESSRSGER